MFDFLLNASLDNVEKSCWTPSANKNAQQAHMYMRTIDKYQELYVSCLLTPSNSKFLLLHENNKSEDQIQSFFNEVYELFVKIIMSPFYDPCEKMNIPQFGEKVRKIA